MSSSPLFLGVDVGTGSARAGLFDASGVMLASAKRGITIAMVPGLWLNEGGQSAAGAAIDQLISFHPASPEAREAAAKAG